LTPTRARRRAVPRPHRLPRGVNRASSGAIEEQITPFAAAVELLCTIPGVERRAAEVLIAETGGDMTAFTTAAHLASWAGVCPGKNESAGKRRSGRTCRGSKGSLGTLIDAARAAARTRDTYLIAQYRRVRARRGANRASLAVAHPLLVAVWHMRQTRETYLDPGGDSYTRRDPGRIIQRLVTQLERLGHTVTLTEGAAA
jgi:transposase